MDSSCELDIPLTFDERDIPWHDASMVSQVSIKLAMRGAVKLHPFELAVFVALIGIEESSEQGMSEIHTDTSLDLLT